MPVPRHGSHVTELIRRPSPVAPGRACRIFAIVIACLLAACARSGAGDGADAGTSSAAQAQQDAVPIIRTAAIMPDPITLAHVISVDVQAAIEGRVSPTFAYQWIVNGHRLPGQTRPTLDAGLLKRGDHVSVEVTPAAGGRLGAPFRTAESLVGNTPPVVSRVQIEPAIARRGDRLRAVVEAADPDHDEVRYRYRWMRNQRLEWETDEPVLETDRFQRGDLILLEVTPSDSLSRGKPAISDLLVLGNSPPQITSTPPLIIDPAKYQYPVTAVDADGDSLSYTLAQGPPGMHIDRLTGQLLWPKPAVSPPAYRVRLLVDDGHDGQAFQEFELTVMGGSVQQSAVSDQPTPQAMGNGQ
jgi:hypothetical protein